MNLIKTLFIYYQKTLIGHRTSEDLHCSLLIAWHTMWEFIWITSFRWKVTTHETERWS